MTSWEERMSRKARERRAVDLDQASRTFRHSSPPDADLTWPTDLSNDLPPLLWTIDGQELPMRGMERITEPYPYTDAELARGAGSRDPLRWGEFVSRSRIRGPFYRWSYRDWWGYAIDEGFALTRRGAEWAARRAARRYRRSRDKEGI